MDWFRHDSNANLDEKLQEVLLDYGLEGYGLYWYCLELIVGKVSADDITFELKHDARVIARNTGSTVQKVEEMMRKFIELGLFENSNGSITCLKVAKRLMTSATSNPQMRTLIQNIKENHNVIEPSRHRHDDVMPDKIRLDKIRTDNRGTRLPIDWQPTKEHIDFCKSERPELDAVKVAEQFKDYWVAKAGSAGVKLDWMATWRNWVRNQKSLTPSVKHDASSWRNDDASILKKAASLGVYTSGKSRFEIVAAIDKKEGRI